MLDLWSLEMTHISSTCWIPLQYSGLPSKNVLLFKGLSWNGGSAKRTKRCCNISTIPILRIARYKSEAKEKSSEQNYSTWNLQKTNMEPENQPFTKENHLSKHLKSKRNLNKVMLVIVLIHQNSLNLKYSEFRPTDWSMNPSQFEAETSISPHQFRTYPKCEIHLDAFNKKIHV